MKRTFAPFALAMALCLGLAACTDPYDPGQRAVGGGLIGAGTGAVIGGVLSRGRPSGVAAGALLGGAAGAIGGAATTPPPQRYYQQPYYQQPYYPQQPYYGY